MLNQSSVSENLLKVYYVTLDCVFLNPVELMVAWEVKDILEVSKLLSTCSLGWSLYIGNHSSVTSWLSVACWREKYLFLIHVCTIALWLFGCSQWYSENVTHDDTWCKASKVKSKDLWLVSLPEHGHDHNMGRYQSNEAWIWPTELLTY